MKSTAPLQRRNTPKRVDVRDRRQSLSRVTAILKKSSDKESDPYNDQVPPLLLNRPISHTRPIKSHPPLFDTSRPLEGRKLQFLDVPESTPEPDANRVFLNVVVRVRPLLPDEIAAREEDIIEVAGRSVEILRPSRRKFSFHAVAGPEMKQVELADISGVENLLSRALRGHYVTIFAYGQTGSGKTHTICGPEEVIGLHERVRIDDPDGTIPETVKDCLGRVLNFQLAQQGLMPRSARYVFDQIVKEEDKDNVQFDIQCSYFQIHEETVLDLLIDDSPQLEVKLNTGERMGFHVPDATKIAAATADDVMSIFMKGAANRKTASHLLNASSSRSHALFVMEIDKKTWVPEEDTLYVRRGKITLVDLAGSETLKQTQTAHQNRREMSTTNQSLLSLGQIFTQFASADLEQLDNASMFRSSKLTMLLMESLTNYNTTTMIACVSPTYRNFVETSNVLSFAKNAASLKPAAEKSAPALSSGFLPRGSALSQNRRASMPAATTPTTTSLQPRPNMTNGQTPPAKRLSELNNKDQHDSEEVDTLRAECERLSKEKQALTDRCAALQQENDRLKRAMKEMMGH